MKTFGTSVGEICSELEVTVSIKKKDLHELQRLYVMAEEGKMGERFADVPVEFEHDGFTYKGGIAIIKRNDPEWPLLNVGLEKWKPGADAPDAVYTLLDVNNWKDPDEGLFGDEAFYTLEDQFCNRLVIDISEED